MTPLQWKRLFFRIVLWGVILLLVFFLYVLGSTTWRVFTKGQEAEELREGAEQNVTELHERKVAIEEALRKLDTPRGIEEEVRKRYELGLPGEEQIVLVAPKPAEEAKSPGSGFFDFLFGWFR